MVRSVVAVLAAALAGQAVALNSHRHLHARAVEERRIHTKVEWVVKYATVTVTEGDKPKTAEADYFNAQKKKPKQKENYAGRRPKRPTVAPPALPAAPTIVAAPAPAAPPPAPPAPPAVEPAPLIGIDVSVPNILQPPPASNVPSYGGGKRGVAYNDPTVLGLFGKSCQWRYNWDSTDNDQGGDGEYVPMLWSDIPEHANRWPGNVEKMLAKGSTHILGPNEPDFPEQANMSPEHCAAVQVQHLNPYGDRARIGGPATSNSNLAGQGNDWLRKFIPACNAAGCKIDFCVTHWYSPISLAHTLIEHLEEVHSICEGRDVWLTEFAPFGSDDEIAKFMEEYLPKLEALPWLKRYSYFMARPGSLLSAPGSLSTYGNTYLSI